ncbi:MAG: DHA2 family efflux MFS transporter permease subunit [Sphingomonadales bacterium]|nr:DHA2 family efflux MFS transporter permease subunit [Sphingomonadales bacterium]
MMLAMMMQILDTTIANVALPHMQTSLGATIDSVTWVLTSYLVASAAAIPLTGWLADRIGSRELFLTAVVFFIVSSMLCGIATSLEQMVFFRILQGICAAFIGPLSQTAMLDINPTHKHGQAMAIWSLGAVLGPILGPLIGGYLTEYYNWRWVFFVNLPIGALTFTILFLLLPGRPLKRRGFDLFGFAFFALGVAALQLMLDRGQQLDWFNSWEIWLGLGATIIGLWVFIIHLITGRETIVSRRIFKDYNFVGSMLFMTVAGALIFASMALLALMLQGVFGYPVIDTGMVLAPRGLGVIVAMGIAARLMGKVDSRLLLFAGFAITAWSFLLMTRWSLDIDSWNVISTGLIQGFGFGLFIVVVNTVAFATLPLDLRAEASALLNLVRSLGASIGIAICATLVARNLQISHSELAEHVNPYALPDMGASILGRFVLSDEARLLLIDRAVNREAFMISYIDSYWLLMVLAAAMAPLALLTRPMREEG